MNDNQATKESVLTQLRSCGVPVTRLHLSVQQDQVEVSGSVESFYALQLIQSRLKRLIGPRKLIQKVSVLFPREQATTSPTTRNRGYRLSMDA